MLHAAEAENARNRQASFPKGILVVHSLQSYPADGGDYSQSYDFFIVNDGLDKRNSMLRHGPGHRRMSSTPAQKSQESNELEVTSDKNPGQESFQSDEQGRQQHADPRSTVETQQARPTKPDVSHDGKTSETAASTEAMHGITNAMSALNLVPPSVRFGRGKGRGGLARS